MRIAISLACLALLGACSSLPVTGKSNGDTKEGTSSGTATNAAGQPVVQEGLFLTGIDQSSLPAGNCGMVLWTVDEDRPKPIFRYISGDLAEAGINGRLVPLSLVRFDGASAFGVGERGFFESALGLKLTVDADFGLGFEGGNYLEDGLITLEDASGWRTVAPVAGIAGCRRG